MRYKPKRTEPNWTEPNLSHFPALANSYTGQALAISGSRLLPSKHATHQMERINEMKIIQKKNSTEYSETSNARFILHIQFDSKHTNERKCVKSFIKNDS